MVKTTSDEIFEAALRLFAEKGYKGTSIGAIEEAVGLAPRAGGFTGNTLAVVPGLARRQVRDWYIQAVAHGNANRFRVGLSA